MAQVATSQVNVFRPPSEPRTATDESKRLRVLADFLSVYAGEDKRNFDSLTLCGARLLDAATCLVVFVDDKMAQSVSVSNATKLCTPRELSYCTHTIETSDAMIVPDTWLDPRFAQNPHSLHAPGAIRFYAGAPLTSTHGFNLGTFCIVDPIPRHTFSDSDLDSLKRFARLASAIIDRRLLSRQIEVLRSSGPAPRPTRVSPRKKSKSFATAPETRGGASSLDAERLLRLSGLPADHGVLELERATGRTFFSARCQAILGFEERDEVAPFQHLLGRLHPADSSKCLAHLHELEENDVLQFCHEYRIERTPDHWRWIQFRGAAVRDSSNRLLRLIGSVADVTDRKLRDPLTGLRNQVAMLDLLDGLVHRKQGADSPFAVLRIGVDDFRGVIASFGNRAGNRVLCEVALRLEETFREQDGAHIGCLGPEEFVAVVTGVDSAERAMEHANAVQEALKPPVYWGTNEVSVSASVGIVLMEGVSSTPQSLLEDAEVAMYRAMKLARGKHVVFTNLDREETKRRVAIVTALSIALEEDEFCLHYQPKIDLRTGALVGFEALVRWKHPSNGLTGPDEFIPYAEESGMIIEIGRWILDHALRQLKSWRTAHLIGSTVTVAVNLSARQFQDPRLTEYIARLLSELELPASLLVLELTESGLIQDDAGAKQALETLKALGVQLDLDDFGTGYSAISYLRRFPFDTIKIDRSFISELGRVEQTKMLVESIIHIGHSLGMKVVAEGIETQEQLAMLQDFGCTIAQGYLFSRPRPAAELVPWIRRFNRAPSVPGSEAKPSPERRP